MADDEMFERLIFYGVTLLGRTEQDVWLMEFGHLLDQWEIYRQFNGLSKPIQKANIDDVIPFGL